MFWTVLTRSRTLKLNAINCICMGMLIREKNVRTLSYLQNAINHTSVYLLVCSESAAILIYTFFVRFFVTLWCY